MVNKSAVVTTTKMTTPLTYEQQLLGRLEEMQTRLIAGDAAFVNHLRMIHMDLVKFPELLHILKDEQIGQIVQASARIAQITIAKESTIKLKRVKAGSVTLDDL